MFILVAPLVTSNFGTDFPFTPLAMSEYDASQSGQVTSPSTIHRVMSSLHSRMCSTMCLTLHSTTSACSCGENAKWCLQSFWVCSRQNSPICTLPAGLRLVEDVYQRRILHWFGNQRDQMMFQHSATVFLADIQQTNLEEQRNFSADCSHFHHHSFFRRRFFLFGHTLWRLSHPHVVYCERRQDYTNNDFCPNVVCNRKNVAGEPNM